MTHGEHDSLISHGLYKRQGFTGGRANVVYSTLLETPYGRTLVSGDKSPPASEDRGVVDTFLALLKA